MGTKKSVQMIGYYIVHKDDDFIWKFKSMELTGDKISTLNLPANIYLILSIIHWQNYKFVYYCLRIPPTHLPRNGSGISRFRNLFFSFLSVCHKIVWSLLQVGGNSESLGFLSSRSVFVILEPLGSHLNRWLRMGRGYQKKTAQD